MKKISLLIILICCTEVFLANAQTIQKAPIKDAKFVINSYGNPELIIKLFPELEEGYNIEPDNFFKLNEGLVLSLISKKNPNKTHKVGKIEYSPAIDSSIRIIVTEYSQELHDLIVNDKISLCISANKNLIFTAYNNNKSLEYEITKADIKKFTTNKFVLTPTLQDELVASKGGGIFIVNNNLNVGAIPSDESSSNKTEYYAEFKYRNKYSFIKKTDVSFFVEGLLSTNAHDSLNYLSVYPVNYNFIKGKNELVGQIGVEGNQTFSNCRVTGNFYWNGLLPNFVNLTFNEDRLRLKPVVKVGLKFYQEIENNRLQGFDDNEFSNQAFVDLYYYIPIMKSYSLILSGNCFYDFNKSANPDSEIMYKYSATLGIEIPKTEFKTIFKYSYGENGISYKKNNTLMVGFLLDIVGIK